MNFGNTRMILSNIYFMKPFCDTVNLIQYKTFAAQNTRRTNKTKTKHTHTNKYPIGQLTINLILVCFCWNMKKKKEIIRTPSKFSCHVLSFISMNHARINAFLLTQTNQHKYQMYLLYQLPSLTLISFWIIRMHLWFFACFMSTSRTHVATLKAQWHNMKGRFLINVTSFFALFSSHFAWVSC